MADTVQTTGATALLTMEFKSEALSLITKAEGQRGIACGVAVIPQVTAVRVTIRDGTVMVRRAGETLVSQLLCALH